MDEKISESVHPTKNDRPQSLIATFALLLSFIATEYLVAGRVASISPYANYIVEIIFIAITFLLFHERSFYFRMTKLGWIGLALTFIVGSLIRYAAGFVGILVPFDFSSAETLVMLLLVGPLLEEFLFRGALFRLLSNLTASSKVLIGVCALAFSLAHFLAYFDNAEIVRPFILYQTGYTLILGMVCGSYRVRYGISMAVLAHLLFNAGFWVAG